MYPGDGIPPDKHLTLKLVKGLMADMLLGTETQHSPRVDQLTVVE